MSTLSPGSTAPDRPLQTIAGETTHLSEIWPDAAGTILIFLRHLA